jgi:hypothetical protein
MEVMMPCLIAMAIWAIMASCNDDPLPTGAKPSVFGSTAQQYAKSVCLGRHMYWEVNSYSDSMLAPMFDDDGKPMRCPPERGDK